MKIASYLMMALGAVMICYVRGAQFVSHPDWTETQSFLQMWPTYMCGSLWLVLGVIGLRLSRRS